MRKLILGAAVLTVLPLLAFSQIRMPALPEPVQLLGKSGRVILLESVRLASAEVIGRRAA